MADQKYEPDMIEGTVEEIVFANDVNGYTVCVIDSGGEPVTVVGVIPYLSAGEHIKVTGVWQMHPTFGRQFRANAFEKELPQDEDAIFRYLSSGSVRGVGPVTARRIVDRFGSDTLEVLENHPEWLAEIRGITVARAKSIGESFCAQFGAREAMIFLGTYFGPALSIRIYKKYRSAAPDIIRSDPYRLCDDVPGVGFAKADKVAHELGFSSDCPERLRAGIKHTLMNAAYGDGHCYIPRHELIDQAARMLGAERAAVASALEECISQGSVVCTPMEGHEACASARIYTAERYTAAKLLLLKQNSLPFALEGVRDQIALSEKKQKIKYDERQISAIEAAVVSGVSVVTGGPGTGKTTVINAIIDIFESLGVKYMLAAPTGRAAKRMTDACGKEAKTIHRMLEAAYSDEGVSVFGRNEEDPLGARAFIIDETSMVDIFLMEALLRALKEDAMIVFIGDSDQLPPVGPGNALNDMIESGLFCVTRLDHIFRQAEKSLIVVNAHRINEGEMPELRRRDGDFFFMERLDSASLKALVCSLCSERLPNAYGMDSLDDIQVITPTRRGECGTVELNRALQESLNPPSHSKREKRLHDSIFREGDKVMQIRNNYDLVWNKGREHGEGIFNGDIGRITRVDTREEYFIIDFDGRVCDYAFELADDLELAYAVTVHKSQGSEYPAVIIPLLQCPSPLMTRNLLYTAVTRAKSLLIAVGDAHVMRIMTENDKKALRFTALPYLFRHYENKTEDVL